jgi:sterol desaturase/sphingolipid hydroxylase (fatty acid hydroxylase superfamily)
MPQLVIILLLAVTFFVAERLHPGRALPNAKGWYARALALNLCQFSLVFVAGATWNRWFQGWSLLHLQGLMPRFTEGALYWFIGTFVFYWWHRLRHQDGWWIAFHQVHHSPSRIEALTAFYKHPLEMVTNSVVISAMIFLVFGGSVEAAAWYNVFAVMGELYYHANIRTPHWTGWFLQRPEHHSIHHERGVHRYNFADITWWDRLFGTFKDTDQFAASCGFGDGREKKLGAMLGWKDVNRN